LIIPLSMRTRVLQNRKLADRLAWVGLTAMGFFSSLFVLTLLRDVVLLGARLLLSGSQVELWVGRSAQATLYLTLFITLAGLIIARRRPGVVEIKIPCLICRAPCTDSRSFRLAMCTWALLSSAGLSKAWSGESTN